MSPHCNFSSLNRVFLSKCLHQGGTTDFRVFLCCRALSEAFKQLLGAIDRKCSYGVVGLNYGRLGP